ncbi:carboxylate-amine ligase [Pseudonocardia sp. CA-107938]|uniref:carboxylate-amine ligase n=1 Tax=Pseudonocardia sp. CA-107938 TaxID=3240021 RepID=UPI003D91C825
MTQTDPARTAEPQDVGTAPRLMGVEEEFLLVDPGTGVASAAGGAVLLAAAAEHDTDMTGELQREQIETGTRPKRSPADLEAELRRTRRQARDAAAAAGAALVPLATSPLATRPTVSPAQRYRRMVELFGLTGSEQLTCGCHVHVAVESDEEGVGVLDRIRAWLPPLLALSSNSPYWRGEDTRYASFRSQVWNRWPSAGPTAVFGSAAAYAVVEQAMLATETVLDTGMVYFDARLSRSHPTVEIRVADVCREIEDAVLIATLCRALVTTAAAEWRAGMPVDPVPIEVLRLATWRAGRSGLSEALLDPRTGRPAPARAVLDTLVDHVGDALDEAGDRDTVTTLLDGLLRRGTGAARQRAVAERSGGDLRAVVLDAIG